MTNPIQAHLYNLWTSLLKLSATGNEGFEGLIGTSLEAITGVPFRLASSGRQDGIDGKSAFANDAIAFEGKLYTGSIPRTEVLTKITDIVKGGSLHADLAWVLGATVPISTQLGDDLRAHAERNGISVLILDWSIGGLPLLGVALAMARSAVAGFLEDHISKKELDQAGAALDAIAADSKFAGLAKRIREMLDAPAMGVAMARRSNTERLSRVLQDKNVARDVLGQALSPADVTATVRLRTALNDQIIAFLSVTPDASMLAIVVLHLNVRFCPQQFQ